MGMDPAWQSKALDATTARSAAHRSPAPRHTLGSRADENPRVFLEGQIDRKRGAGAQHVIRNDGPDP
jgi:hypothetical protein